MRNAHENGSGWYGLATDALRPTVEALQVSAFGLLDAMIAVGRTPAKEGV